MIPKSETASSVAGDGSTSDHHRKEKDGLDNDEFVEEADSGQQHSASVEAAEADAYGLSQEHRDYLLNRHGTLDLDPIPDMADADPYNWSSWKVLYFSPSLRAKNDC